MEKYLMKTILLISVILFSLPCVAQQTTFQDSLLDRMIGNWILQGTIAGRETTHDITVEWVLAHQYVRLYEISREKDSSGHAAYEATVYFGWDQSVNQYACLWLDITGGGGLSAQAIGHAKRTGNEIPFVFKGSDGSLFHTTFVYEKATDTWKWLMDGEENGKILPFARVKLQRKR
jgi:hypothetical protein